MTYYVWYEDDTRLNSEYVARGELTWFKKMAKIKGYTIRSIEKIAKDGKVTEIFRAE